MLRRGLKPWKEFEKGLPNAETWVRFDQMYRDNPVRICILDLIKRKDITQCENVGWIWSNGQR